MTSPAQWRLAPEESREFRRILTLPRRELRPTAELAADLTRLLWRGPCSDPTCPHLSGLRPIQAAALLEATEVGGLFAPIGVGWGKTLIALLLPVVLGVRKAVLLVPPQLRDQLQQRDYPHLAQHYRLPNLHGHGQVWSDVQCWLHLVAYSELQNPKRADILERIAPELIVADEVHWLANTGSTRYKRVREFRRKHASMFCGMSGTATKGAIRDFAHIIHWALGEGSPVPRDFQDLEQWGAALDSGGKAGPGVLLRFGGTTAWEAFRRRLNETPGVVATEESALGTSLYLAGRNVKVPHEVDDLLVKLRKEWELPSGETFDDILKLGAAARQLACGFYYRWVWPNGPDREWLAARRDWNRAVREFLTHRSRPWLDSPALLAEAAARGEGLKAPGKVWQTEEGWAWNCPEWAAWAAVRDRPEPPTVPVWVSDFLLRDIVEHVADRPVLVWYEHDAVGAALAKLTGWVHLGADSDAELRQAVRMHSGPMILSVKAHGTGKDGLQKWSESLCITPASGGAIWEQRLGRTHRVGQTADEVRDTVYVHTPELRRAFRHAMQDARAIQGTMGGQQKLCYANLDSLLISSLDETT